MNNVNDALQFTKDVIRYEVIDVYVENKVSEPLVIVDPSEIDNYIDEDGVQYTSFSQPNIEVNEPEISEGNA